MSNGIPKWGELALELAQRATRYGKEADDSNNSSAGRQAEEHTPVTFGELSSSSEHPKDAQWWWPQVPLLTALLKGNSESSIATWVSLGRYRSDKSSGGMKPDWTTFLCPALSTDKMKSSIKSGLTTLTTDLKEQEPNRQFFSTTELVDALSEKAEKRPLAPLLLCFQKEAQLLNSISGKQPFIICRWEKLRSNGRNSPTSQQHCPYCNSGSCISGGCRSPQANSCQLDGTTWFNRLDLADKQGHCRRLNHFAAWLLNLQEVPQWDVMLTVPAWKPDQLPGVHVGAIVVYVRKDKWLSKLLAKKTSSRKNLIEQIGIFSATFRAGATIAMQRELEQYREMAEQVEKQAQMLRLVETPLKRLSEALETMQESTQTLRAVLYEPSGALFSAAPHVERYFVDKGWVGDGALRWQCAHDWNNPADLQVAQKTLAAIILEIFGKASPWPQSYEELLLATRKCLANGGKEFSDLKKQLVNITRAQNETQLWGWFGSPHTTGLDKETFGGALMTIKEILHRPFKEGDFQQKIAPLLLILDEACSTDTGKTISFCYEDKTLTETDIWQQWNCKLSRLSTIVFPVPRYAHWLRFIQGVISYAKQEKKATIATVGITSTVQSWTFSMEFSPATIDKVFEAKGVEEIYEKMRVQTGKGAELAYHGNFAKPFIEFAMLAEGIIDEKSSAYKLQHKARAPTTPDSSDWINFNCYTTVFLHDNNFRYELELEKSKGAQK